MIAIYPLIDQQQLRGCNSSGCGHFGAGRGGRYHNGVDILAEPGDAIKAPFSGRIIRKGFRVYSDSRPNLLGMEIEAESGERLKIFYCSTSYPVGTRFKRGQRIGTVQNMAQYYSDAMPNHIHIEIRDKNGFIQDVSLWMRNGKGGTVLTLTALGIITGVVIYSLVKKEK